MTVTLTSENYKAEVEESDLPVVIDAFAPWCGPCQQMMPIFEELSKELGDKYKFAKINIDENRNLATKLNVSSIPTFIFVKSGKVIGKETGYMSKNIIKEKIESLLD